MKKILIVEDEQAIREALVSKLSYEGFDVSFAINGKDGLEKVQKEMPDLILLDVIMPEMDGLTLFRRLRNDEKTRNIGVIMLTNLSDTETITRSMREGIFDYLVKSDWQIEDVVQKVKEYLENIY